MKQDFPAKSFSLPKLFTVEDIILLFISISMMIEYACIHTRREIIPLARYGTPFVLLAFRLKTKENYRLLTDWRVEIPYSKNNHIHTYWRQYKTIFTIMFFEMYKLTNVQIKNYVHYIYTLFQKIALLQLYNLKSLYYNK